MTGSADAHASLLEQLILELGVPVVRSRSVRLVRSALFTNRWLYSPVRRALYPEHQARVRRLCAQLGPPPEVLSAIERELPGAAFIHFGMEQGPDGWRNKIYVEPPRPQSQREANVGYLAYKWRVADPRDWVTTRYIRVPLVSLDELHRLIEQHFLGRERTASLELTKSALAAAQLDVDQLQALEVSEATTVRRSLSLNLYDAHLTIAALRGAVEAVGREFAITELTLGGVIDELAEQPLGHVAVGRHRDGGEFVTLYYGADRI